eukprot:4609093-Prymnesium_polylepis.1
MGGRTVIKRSNLRGPETRIVCRVMDQASGCCLRDFIVRFVLTPRREGERDPSTADHVECALCQPEQNEQRP